MPITTAFNPNRWSHSVYQMLYEWMKDTNCFGTSVWIETSMSSQEPYANKPRCHYGIINVKDSPTGPGRQGKHATFRTVTIEIKIKSNVRKDPQRTSSENAVIKWSDKLDTYFRSSNGYAKLGAAGLCKAKLTGPFKSDTREMYQRLLILTFRIEVV